MLKIRKRVERFLTGLKQRKRAQASVYKPISMSKSLQFGNLSTLPLCAVEYSWKSNQSFCNLHGLLYLSGARI